MSRYVLQGCKDCIGHSKDGESLSAPRTVGLNRLHLFTKTTEQAHDDTHYVQRRRRHFKSGQATAYKKSLVHVHVGGVYRQAMCSSKKQNAAIQETS